jgi:hypothetical protein
MLHCQLAAAAVAYAAVCSCGRQLTYCAHCAIYAVQACCAKAQCQWALATAYTCKGGATVFKVDCCADALQGEAPSLQAAPVLCTGTSFLSLGFGSMSPYRAQVSNSYTAVTVVAVTVHAVTQ